MFIKREAVKRLREVEKPKPIKGMKISYNGITYDNILYVSRGYDYSSFSYLDEKGNSGSISFDPGSNNSFTIITE